jgi:hypothetical protein
MKRSTTVPQTPATAAEDRSVCLEWQGLLHHSYDSVDSLLREFTHAASAQPAAQTATVEVTLVGQYDGLLPLSHYVL